MSRNTKQNQNKNQAGKPLKPSKCKFTQEEDIKLVQLIMSHKEHDWAWIASQMPNRNPRQCRERWANYLDPNLHKGAWTLEEDNIIIEKKKIHGQKWSVIASFLKGRSGNDVRNRWLMLMRHNGKIQQLKNKGIFKEEISKQILGLDKTDVESYNQKQLPIYNLPEINHATGNSSPVEIVKTKKLVFPPIYTLIPDLQYLQFVF